MNGYAARLIYKVDNQDLYQKEAQRLQFEVNDFSLTAAQADSARAVWIETIRTQGAEVARSQLIVYSKLMTRADSLRNDYNRSIRFHVDSYFEEFHLPRQLY
jgi:hypothetical protein